MMNVGLFFKLWAMEDITHRMYLSTKHRLRERAEARSGKLLLLLRDNCCVGVWRGGKGPSRGLF